MVPAKRWVPLAPRLSSALRLRPRGRRLRPLPVEGAVGQARGQLVSLGHGRVNGRGSSGTVAIPPQYLDLVAVLLRRDAAAAVRGRAAAQGDLVAPGRGGGDASRSGRGHSCRISLAALPRLTTSGRRRWLIQVDRREAGSPLRAADHPQVFSVRAVIDPPAVRLTLCDGGLRALAAHVVQPDIAWWQ